MKLLSFSLGVGNRELVSSHCFLCVKGSNQLPGVPTGSDRFVARLPLNEKIPGFTFPR